MHKDTLQAVLLKRHREGGLSLVEPDDHFLVLRHGGQDVARFSSPSPRVVDIRATADRYLDNLPGHKLSPQGKASILDEAVRQSGATE